jgi:hypothetical protein
VSTVDIETLLSQDDLRALLENCEQTGSIRAPDVNEIVETHELTGLEQEALVRELDKRGIEIVEAPPVERAPVAPAPVESTTDALQLFLREAGGTTTVRDRGRCSTRFPQFADARNPSHKEIGRWRSGRTSVGWVSGEDGRPGSGGTPGRACAL